MKVHPRIGESLRAAGALAALVAAGWLSRPLAEPAWAAVRQRQPELSPPRMEAAVGQGLVLGVLGGFRSICADLLWIRLYAAWEESDRPRVEALANLVTAIDPRPAFFWINAARIIAYDMPAWRLAEGGGPEKVTPARRAAIDREQAEQAFDLLRRGLEFHPRDPLLPIEFAQIHLNRLRDLPAAAEWFGRAAALPDAPPYAARMQAELLRQAGRPQAALDRLTRLHPTLPSDDPTAQADVVLQRIRDLEQDLAVPPAQQYRP